MKVTSLISHALEPRRNISVGPRMFAAAVFRTSPLRLSHWASSLATLRLKCLST